MFSSANRKADYVIGLKANQGRLYDQIADWFERVKPILQAHVSRDLGHERAEKRTVWVSKNLALIDAAVDWVGRRSIICVESSRWFKGTAR